MKVLILGHSYYAEENRKQLTEISRALGRELFVGLPSSTGQGGLFDFSTEELPSGGPGYHIRVLRLWPSERPSRSVLPGLKSCIDEFRPDLVHCEWSPQSLPALQLAVMKRLHVFDAVLFGTLRQPVVNFTGRWYGTPLAMVTRELLGEYDGLQVCTSLSEEVFVEVLELEPSDMPQTHLVYQTGVDTAEFRPPNDAQRREARAAVGVGDDEIVVGYCGRFVPEKGLLDLVEAAATIRERAEVGREVSLALLGAGPLEPSLVSTARDYGVPVSVLPVRPHAEVAEFMWALDAFTLPSRVRSDWVEHDAHVVVEAMACGVPVVGTTSGATPEVVSDAGYTVPPGEPDALAEALEAVILGSDSVSRAKARGRERVCQHFSHRAVARKLVAAWKGAAGRDG